MNEDEVEIMVEHTSNNRFTARAIHRTTGTIKISDTFDEREEAIKDALEGLTHLIEERLKGLGDSKLER